MTMLWRLSGISLILCEFGQEDNDSHGPNEEEFDWEDGDEGARVGGADDTTPLKGWSGKVTFDADGSPGEELEKRSKKSPLRRANANDKVFKLAKLLKYVDSIFREVWENFSFHRGLLTVHNSDFVQVWNGYLTWSKLAY